jgi:hypothetical protein
MKLNLLLLSAAALFNAATATESAVELGTAANYAILTKSGISTASASDITGHIAVSPIAATAITGFDLILESGGQYSTSTQVTKKVFAASYGGETETKLIAAVGFMGTAYTDAAGRDNTDAERINLGAGLLGGVFGGEENKLTPGVYTFDTGVSIGGDIFFEGSETDVFIVQIAGSLSQAANTKVTLSGGALAKNIFWQVAGHVKVGAGANLKGVVLVKTNADFMTGSSLNGRVLAQTACSLDQVTVA